MTAVSPPDKLRLYLSFLAVYILWGSTYVAIAMVVTGGLPPLVSAGVRMLIAGTILALFCKLRGQPMPTRADMPWLFVSGTLYFLGGNGLVMIAERSVPSGIAALVVATTPFWLTGFEALLPGGEHPPLLGWLGILLGFAGVAVLRDPSAGVGVGTGLGGAFFMLLCAPVSWAAAGITAKHELRGRPALTVAAFQMLFGGLALCAVGSVRGEWLQWQPTMTGLLALAYLIVGGSLLGFVGFVYLIQHAPAAQVATYAYVNPAVALLLGFWLRDEPIGPSTLLGAGIILAGVGLVQLATRKGH